MKYIKSKIIATGRGQSIFEMVGAIIHSFGKTLKIENRMEFFSDQHVYITLKDHKQNFRNNTKCRLINISKSEAGCLSKSYLNDFIADVSHKTKLTIGTTYNGN